MDITEAGGENTLGWVQNEEINADWYTKNYDRKDGSNIFTFAKPDGINCENSQGTLNSSIFTLKQNSYVSFRFGGAGTREVWIVISSSTKPRVVMAGVPTRTPEVTKGFSGSLGMAFLLTVI